MCTECSELAETVNLSQAVPPSAQLDVPVDSAAGLSLSNAPPNNLHGLVDTTSQKADDRVDAIKETVTKDPARLEHETFTHAGIDCQTRLPTPPAGYDLIRRLGGGGMGDVFEARELSTERIVAMKFLRQAANPTATERFLTEVRVLARLEHPNIIKVLATDFYREVPFFTMEFMNGGPLSERVSKKGPLDPIEAAKIIATVARAIDAAHQAGVLHRDLKPSNILLGQDDIPKVADFGLAKRTDRDDELTLTGPLGTHGFMPPEQVSRKHGALGPAADVFGLGATLYYLLSGLKPYAGENPVELAAFANGAMLKRLRALRQGVPAELEAIVFKCLEKETTQRYTSAIALAEDLDRFLAGQVPLAPQLTPLRRFKQWVIRQRSYLAGAATILAIAIGIAALWPKPETLAERQAVIQRDLQAGRTVTLVGETGLPKYYQWRLGGGGFGASLTGEKYCYYESVGNTLLELVPDPGIDSYRLLVELRQEGAKKDGQGDDSDRSFLGPYFGYAEHSTTDGKKVVSMFSLSFADSHKNAKLPMSKKKNTPAQLINVVKPRRVVVQMDPQMGSNPTQKEFAPFQFDSLNNPIGPWRTFQIDVTPTRVLVGWKRDDGNFETILDLSYEQTLLSKAEVQERYSEAHPGAGILLPEWGPRMPMGIWSFKAALSIRKVSISPLTTTTP